MNDHRPLYFLHSYSLLAARLIYAASLLYPYTVRRSWIHPVGKPKSCALDSLPTDILKLTLPVHLDTITKLVNTSFSTGVFPSALKRAVVSPILKKAGCDRNCLQNYRPVSNLPFVSKVVEKIAAKRLIEHPITGRIPIGLQGQA